MYTSYSPRDRLGFWIAFVMVAMFMRSAVGEEPFKPQRAALDYVIVVTGDELLAGAYADAHTPFIARTLGRLGLRCVGSMIVGDERPAIKEALRFATGKARLVIVTGGLGPTDNDVTREALAEFTGIAMAEQPDVLAEMERRFKVPREELRPGLRRQTRVPTSGTYLKNAAGTAVGLVFELGERVIVALPGPPRELQPMVREELVPYLTRRFGTRRPGCSVMLRFVGVGQSQIDQAMKEHAPLPAGVTVFSTFEGGRVDFTFSLPDDTPQNRARLAGLKEKILAAKDLGDCVYADDETSLEEHVARLLKARGATLALVEAAGGGGLAAGFSAAPSARSVLAGACAAPTEEKLRRLLRVPDGPWAAAAPGAGRAELLATAASQWAASQWAVAVGEGVQAADGDRLAAVAFHLPGGHIRTRQIALRGAGELARANLATQVLDVLRRELRSP